MTEEKQRSLFMVYTGNGKGKSTAAFGLAFRLMGRGHRVAMIQFIKGKWQTGERMFAETLPLIDIHVMGLGFTWESKDLARDKRAAELAWEKAESTIQAGEHRAVILDELTYTIHHGFLTVDPILKAIRERPPHVTVLITGRNADPAFIEAADLVSEIHPVKHPFQQGMRALKGVDY